MQMKSLEKELLTNACAKFAFLPQVTSSGAVTSIFPGGCPGLEPSTQLSQAYPWRKKRLKDLFRRTGTKLHLAVMFKWG